jgi:thiosulfate dehydrogenase [quinone] large subunit
MLRGASVDATSKGGQHRRIDQEVIMALITRGARRVPAPAEPVDTVAAETTRTGTVVRFTAAVTRLSLGWVFLWAFLDKTFGLGYATPAEGAWIDGGSPTEGFLANAATGPFQEFYNGIAGAAWADWLFMIGLAGIGIALIAGVTMRIAAAAGAVLLVMMWTAVLPPENNPFMDDHIVYALVLVLLAALGAGRTWGLGNRWEKLPIVKRYPILK